MIDDRDPSEIIHERLYEDMLKLEDRIRAIFPRQLRWRPGDIRLKVNPTRLYNPSLVMLAIYNLIEKDEIEWDDDFFLRAKSTDLKLATGTFGYPNSQSL